MSDPHRLFNASLSGTRRAIDLRADEKLDADAFAALIREAIALNVVAS